MSEEMEDDDIYHPQHQAPHDENAVSPTCHRQPGQGSSKPDVSQDTYPSYYTEQSKYHLLGKNP